MVILDGHDDRFLLPLHDPPDPADCLFDILHRRCQDQRVEIRNVQPLLGDLVRADADGGFGSPGLLRFDLLRLTRLEVPHRVGTSCPAEHRLQPLLDLRDVIQAIGQ